MRDPFTEMINFFKTNPTYLIVILLVILFFYLVGRAKQENSSNVVKTKKCPMCGGSLVREDGVTKCSNYPKCRYKK